VNGVEGASGTIDDPTTLPDAILRVTAGETIQLRDGKYTYSDPVKVDVGNDGTSLATKNIFAYNGEVPILSFAAMPEDSSLRGLTLNGDYWHVKGLIVEEAGDNGIYIGGNRNTVERCITRKNHDTGLQLGRASSDLANIADWPSNNLILACESYDNKDDATGENADGFACKLTTGAGNVFRGCVSHNNIDDGWDLYTKTDTGPIGPVLIEDCIAYNNGTLTDGTASGNGDRNGFKLGGSDVPVNHVVRRCLAYNNGQHGFTYNSNPGSIEITNCTSVGNAERNFNFDEGTHVFKNNLSYQTGSSDRIVGTDQSDTNCWSDGDSTINTKGLFVSSEDFVSTTLAGVPSYDDAAGRLDMGDFFAVAQGSDLIDQGVISDGIEYNGPAPDIGAVER
jgi:hypothetical protein